MSAFYHLTPSDPNPTIRPDVTAQKGAMDRTNVHFLTGERENSCLMDPLVQYCSLGIVNPNDRVLPVLNIGYALEQLMPLARLFGEMKRVGAQPQLHIWGDAPMMWVAAAFEYRMPSHDVLIKILGEHYTEDIKGVTQWNEVGAIASMRMPFEETQRFLKRFQRARQARVLVLEATADSLPQGSTVQERNPLADFQIPIENLQLRPLQR